MANYLNWIFCFAIVYTIGISPTSAQQGYQYISQGDLKGLKKYIEEDQSRIHELDASNSSLLIYALMASQKKIADYLVELDVDLEHENQSGYRALHTALMYGQHDIAGKLIDKGADVNAIAVQHMQYTPLMLAVSYGGRNSSLIDKLLDKGADPFKTNQHNQSAILFACQNNYQDAAKKFLEARDEDTSLNTKDRNGYTILLWAYYRASVPIIKLLEENGADFDLKTKDGKTILHLACISNSDAVVRRAYEKVGGINILDNSGFSPLGYASQRSESMVKFLIEKGAKPNAGKSAVNKPLANAAMYANAGICKYLIESGAEIDATNANGESALHVAAHGGHPQWHWNQTDPNQRKRYDIIVKLLVEEGANVELKDKAGNTPLDIAIEDDLFSAVDLMIANITDVKIDFANRKNLLHWAADNELPNTLRYGISKLKLDVNRLDEMKQTPLAIAVGRNSLDSVKILVENKATIDFRDEGGQTLLHLAAWSGNRDIVAFLISKGCDTNWRTLTGNTPLHAAAWKGHVETVGILLEQSADPNAVDSDKFVPLHKAAHQGHLDVVKLLVENGADPKAKDELGFDALDKAKGQNKSDVVNYLKSIR